MMVWTSQVICQQKVILIILNILQTKGDQSTKKADGGQGHDRGMHPDIQNLLLLDLDHCAGATIVMTIQHMTLTQNTKGTMDKVTATHWVIGVRGELMRSKQTS